MADRKAKTKVAINETIAMRWSGRAYIADKAVERDKLIAILEAARWAPSCFNDQPWKYMLWDRFQDPENWQRAFDCLVEKNRLWVQRAPMLMLALASTRFGYDKKPNRWGQYDTGAASENICLQAATSGLMAHQMGGFDAARIQQVFAIPEVFTPMAMIVIGYPGDIDSLEEGFREGEVAERQRKSFADICYEGTWGAAVKK